jgi:lactose/L-arabinose transport system substrate-binding protein
MLPGSSGRCLVSEGEVNRLPAGPRQTGKIGFGALGMLALLTLVCTLIQILPRLGVAQADPDDRRAVVDIWGWNIAGASLSSLAPEFEARRPDVNIDVTISGTAMQSRFLLSMASGRGAPDIMQLQEREAGKYTNTGRLAEFTSWAAKHEKDFPASFWKSCLFEGKVYAIPWDIGPCAVFYKRWIFDQYGIDPQTIETWDDFLAAGKTMYEKSNGTVRLMPLASNALKDPFQMLILQNGGGVFDDEGRIIFDNPRNRDALELLRKLLDSGICSPISSSEELLQSYNGDIVAAYPGAAWLMANMKESAASRSGEWGVFRLPAFGPGGLRTSNHGGSVCIVPAQSDVVEPAGAFLEYAMCTVDAQLKQYNDWGLFPAYLPVHSDPRFNTPDPFFGNQIVTAVFAKDFDQLKPLIRTSDWDEAETYIGQALYDWARLREDNDAFLKRVARTLSERFGRELAS